MKSPHSRSITIFLRSLCAVLFMIFLIMLPVFQPELLAQPAHPMDPSAAPIDGGLLFLAAGGGAYAIKKLRDKKKE